MGKVLKKSVTIRIDAEVVEKAKELGLNISKVCENALKEKIAILESYSGKRSSVFGEAFSEKGSVEPRAGFEPATHGLRGRCYTGLSYRGFPSC